MPALKLIHFSSLITPSSRSPILTIECRQFVPATGDKIDLEWWDGNTFTIVRRPPYAIVSYCKNIFLAPLNLDQV